MSKTLLEYKNDYLSYLQATADKTDQKVDAFGADDSWRLFAGAVAGVLIDLYANLTLVRNTIFPQNAVGQQVDLWLYKQGLPERGQQTYTTLQVKPTSVPVTIAANVEFTSAETGFVFTTLNAYDITTSDQFVTLYATVLSPNIIESVGNSLVNSGATITLNVYSSTNGQVRETDEQAIIRVLQSLQSPQGNVRETDYQIFILQTNALLPVPVITQAYTIPSFKTVGDVGILGCFALGGTPITQYQLDLGILPATTFVELSRSVGDDVVTEVETYIQFQRLVGLSVVSGTCKTFQVATDSSPYTVEVTLIPGYELTTEITIDSQNSNLEPTTSTMTIEQLIKRQVRYAICSQPLGGIVIGSTHYVLRGDIQADVNKYLSAQNGLLAQILLNLEITSADIAVPDKDYHPVNIYYAYDIESYDSVTVTEV